MNPPKNGGVGNFIVKTKQGKNIVDENLIFGIIGIADISSSLISSSV